MLADHPDLDHGASGAKGDQAHHESDDHGWRCRPGSVGSTEFELSSAFPMAEFRDAALSEAMIARLVHTFYGRVRQDDLIGPIFNARVSDWNEHLDRLCAFWSSVILRTARYDGRPLRPHLMLPLEGRHFDRWLDLFEATAAEVLPAEAALVFVERARRIADSFEMSIGTQRGEIRPPRHQGRPPLEPNPDGASPNKARLG